MIILLFRIGGTDAEPILRPAIPVVPSTGDRRDLRVELDPFRDEEAVTAFLQAKQAAGDASCWVEYAPLRQPGATTNAHPVTLYAYSAPNGDQVGAWRQVPTEGA